MKEATEKQIEDLQRRLEEGSSSHDKIQYEFNQMRLENEEKFRKEKEEYEERIAQEKEEKDRLAEEVNQGFICV